MCAGVIFTVNLISGNKNGMLMEVASDVGENVVSGTVKPDTYLYERKTKKITRHKGDMKIIMDKKDMTNIIRIATSVEKHYKYPQDIEWAIDKENKIWILQSRPITTL